MRALSPRLWTVAAEVERILEARAANFRSSAVAPASPGLAAGRGPIPGISSAPATVVDVGCDHAGLALTLLHRRATAVNRGGAGGTAARVIAVDRKPAPCAVARRNAARLGLPLIVLEGDGLDPVEGFVDVVVLCGVGSETAVGVLCRAAGSRAAGSHAADRFGTAVVQPNDEGSTLRRWAAANGRSISRERGVWDGGRYYGIFLIEPGGYEPGGFEPDEVELAWGPASQVDREALSRRLAAEISRLEGHGKSPELAQRALQRLSR